MTDRLWVVIPTRDDHPELLAALVDGCGVPRERIVLVNTGDHPVSRYRTRVVTDRGQVNIQRWWNRGIDYAEAMGATHVAVLNDDVRLAPGSLARMMRALADADATLAWADSGRMTGWAWLLRLDRGVRPDERFRWWYGDNDLHDRATVNGGVAYTPDSGVEHVHPNEATSASPQLRALAESDADTYRSRRGAR